MKPLIFINLKTYKSGNEAVKLAKAIESVDKDIIIGVQASDIYRISKETRLKLYSQHVEQFKPGRNTGYVLPESVKANGAVGTFLNHSEQPLKLKEIKETISRCKDINLKTAVFTKSLKEAKEIERFNPDYLIYEPLELVAGDISVSTSKPEVIEKIARSIKMPILVGAGIKTNLDLRKSIELGAVGIIVSSAITTAKDPKKVLMELLRKQ